MHRSSEFLVAATPVLFASLAIAAFNWAAGSRWEDHWSPPESSVLAQAPSPEMPRKGITRDAVMESPRPCSFVLAEK